ncbi:amidohydrolase [Segetibacter sp. 3557_3]|uniref:amidohydrolase family protein n=1 Tax=Segetibacter sp. 3557_3 TaxID=2547429 RepID=UPI0010589716|nr:amidohydrolase family protein [Segetibacter sp. 3557_3]TDH26251.1 amidohydrolase [Segetibacter sp. 3557_3]
MALRKWLADQLFTGSKLLGDQQVLIADESGTIVEIVPYPDAGDNVESLNGILCPGFVNCHCHLELSHMRGLIPAHTGLVDFVFKVVTQRHFPDGEILEAIGKAEDEMIASGIVAVGDICNNVLTIGQKTQQRIRYYNFIEASGWLPTVADTRFHRALDNLKAFTRANLQLSRSSIVPHAPYSVSDALWHAITPYFASKTVTIHNQETSGENAFFQEGTGDFLRMYNLMKIDNSFHKPTGKTSLQSYLPKLRDAATLLLVHNTFTSEADVVFAMDHARSQQQDLYWCLCINANKYIEEKIPPVDALRSQGAQVVVGTDSLASNWSLSMLDELKSLQTSFPHIPLEEMLGWATENGARALGMSDVLGSFETGKRPGILQITNVDRNELTTTTAVKRML